MLAERVAAKEALRRALPFMVQRHLAAGFVSRSAQRRALQG